MGKRLVPTDMHGKPGRKSGRELLKRFLVDRSAAAQHNRLEICAEHFFERSDNYSLALKGVVAHTAGGWGTPPTYHKPDDDIAHLDFDFMTTAIQSLIEPLRWLANSDFVPQWLPGRQPKEH